MNRIEMHDGKAQREIKLKTKERKGESKQSASSHIFLLPDLPTYEQVASYHDYHSHIFFCHAWSCHDRLYLQIVSPVISILIKLILVQYLVTETQNITPGSLGRKRNKGWVQRKILRKSSYGWELY